MNSVYVEWDRPENQPGGEVWDFVGATLMRDFAEMIIKETGDESFTGSAEEAEEANFPSTNYAYPIGANILVPNKTIMKICEQTSCTVVYNLLNDQYYLCLTGGGMDFTQSIALAYIFIFTYIPSFLLDDIYFTDRLSVSKRHYKLVIQELIKAYKLRKSISRDKLFDLNKIKY
jgi:hypothetical protein